VRAAPLLGRRLIVVPRFRTPRCRPSRGEADLRLPTATYLTGFAQTGRTRLHPLRGAATERPIPLWRVYPHILMMPCSRRQANGVPRAMSAKCPSALRGQSGGISICTGSCIPVRSAGARNSLAGADRRQGTSEASSIVRCDEPLILPAWSTDSQTLAGHSMVLGTVVLPARNMRSLGRRLRFRAPLITAMAPPQRPPKRRYR
jgi:hypothetical protein